MYILFLYPSWNKACGISEYTRSLTEALSGKGNTVQVISNTAELRQYITKHHCDLIHIQHQYSLYDIEDLKDALGSCVIPTVITVHTISKKYSKAQEHHNIILNSGSSLIVHSAAARLALLSYSLKFKTHVLQVFSMLNLSWFLSDIETSFFRFKKTWIFLIVLSPSLTRYFPVAAF